MNERLRPLWDYFDWIVIMRLFISVSQNGTFFLFSSRFGMHLHTPYTHHSRSLRIKKHTAWTVYSSESAWVKEINSPFVHSVTVVDFHSFSLVRHQFFVLVVVGRCWINYLYHIGTVFFFSNGDIAVICFVLQFNNYKRIKVSLPTHLWAHYTDLCARNEFRII